MLSILFFDDWHLARRVNMDRKVGRPEIVTEGTIQDPVSDTAWGYPSVLKDPETGRWRCYYEGMVMVPGVGNRLIPLLAESDDGIHWELPDLSGTLDIPDRVCPNQLMGVGNATEMCCVFEDERAEPAERFKALSVSHVWISPDGLRWEKNDSMRWSMLRADPGYFAFWNRYRESYVITQRPKVGDRRIAVNETRDWSSFTEPEWSMQPDALDSPCSLIYGMPVFPYEQIFIGLVWMFHTDPVIDIRDKYIGELSAIAQRPDEEHARVMGKIDCQLSYSLNGWQFQRTLRDPFLPNSPPGEQGSGTIYPSSMVLDGDTIRIYSSASRGEHAQVIADPERCHAAILTHRLRRDGFVYLEPTGGTGELTTRILLWRGDEPQLNVEAPHGQVLVEVTDPNGRPMEGYGFEDCVPFVGDSVNWVPRWRTGRTLNELSEKVVRLSVRIANGRLYALRGNMEFLTLPEARRYLVAQKEPGYSVVGGPSIPIPGFYTSG